MRESLFSRADGCDSLDPFHRCRNQLQFLIQLHSRRIERILPIVSHDRPNGEAIVRDHLRFFGRRLLRLSLDVSDPTDLLFQLFLDMTVRFTDRLCDIFQIMKLTNLMRHCWELVLQPPNKSILAYH